MAVSVAIIGAGFGGLGMAMSLRRAGLTDFTVFERADDLGGVWRDNSYPGAACDVPSSLYSYSFAPNRTWPRRYSGQSDILDYLRRTARESGVLDRVRFGTEVLRAEFDESTLRWRLHLADGRTHEADVLVPAVGQLSRPAIPELAGAETFTGATFHSARWDHDTDLTGKRVAVIGTGASAIQFVPRIQPVVGQLTIFQRSAPYIVPKPDRGYLPLHHRLFRTLPSTQTAGRLGTWVTGELLTFALTSAPSLRRLVRSVFRLHLHRQVSNPALRSRLVPDYQIGCKRLLFSNDYLPALDQPNVDVVTEPIDRITPSGVRTSDGHEHPADVIVYGTGFRATEFLMPMRVQGLAGRDLADEWADGAKAHLGITVPGFPNMFLVYGPNTNLGGNSIIYMIEAQCRYIVQAVRRIAALRQSCWDIRPEVARRFDAEMTRRLGDTVWSGCSSWYREPGGRVSTNWPGLVWEYHRRTARLDPAEFREVKAGA
ncbi:MAG TPA: NAD(P)/FAD-dependent oxidoreductase [Pseudonocardiaceae bacterium]|jgi:cation diffusion facilitator CzcD-associated flavoprotein CzcO|nr:NAD(P)/FAD-dependent oxidoreductase [Pseudonocardiaceae bacterium]